MLLIEADEAGCVGTWLAREGSVEPKTSISSRSPIYGSMPDVVRQPAITERAVRPIGQLDNLTDQRAKFQELIGQVE